MALPHPAERSRTIVDTLAFLPLAAVDPAAVDALLDQAFGAERRGRTAYRLREGVAAIPHLSFATLDGDGALLAAFQSWPVEIAGDDGTVVPLVLAGPIAVRPGRQRDGLGRAITAHALAAIDRDRDGAAATVLIGDPEYYGRFFGFTDADTGGWRVPGPVERRRLLTRTRGDATLPVAGALRPRSA